VTAPDEELTPLGDFAARVLAAERAHVVNDGVRAERLFARVLGTVGVGVVAVAAGASAATAATAATAKGSTAATAASAAISLKVALGVAAATFVLGAGAGVAFERAHHVEPPQPPAPQVLPPAPPGPPVTPEAPSATSSEPTPAPPSAPPSAPVTAHPTASAAPPTSSASPEGKDAELAAERALIDRARTALGRGDPSAALEAVAAHEARFPRGRLAEERELVAIQALSRGGRAAETKARADRFRKVYPKSVFLPAIARLAPP